MNCDKSFGSSVRKIGEAGSVITEFAIVLPLLVVFFLGISGMGQLLGHVTWISQTTYAAALFAADVPQSDGAAKVQSETARLKGIQARGQVTGTWDAPIYFNGAITGKPIVSVSVPAHVSPFMRTFFATDVGVSVAAPYLVPNQATFAGLGDYGNATGAGCVGVACNPVIPPYNPGTKELEIRKLTGEGFAPVSSLKDPASEAIAKSFSDALNGGSNYSDLLSKYSDAGLLTDPELVNYINGLNPKGGGVKLVKGGFAED